MRAQAARWVSGLDGGFLSCRTLRHHWRLDRFEAGEQPRRGRQEIVRRAVCDVCGTVRTDLYTRERRTDPFARDRSRYTYPKGYSWKGLDERPLLGDYFGEQYRRFLQDQGTVG